MACEHVRNSGYHKEYCYKCGERMDGKTVHEIKTHPPYFDAVRRGDKTFEIRKNDRGYRVGDRLLLCEFDPEFNRFTGNTVEREVTYIAQGVFGLPDDVCVMSIEPAAR